MYVLQSIDRIVLFHGCFLVLISFPSVHVVLKRVRWGENAHKTRCECVTDNVCLDSYARVALHLRRCRSRPCKKALMRFRVFRVVTSASDGVTPALDDFYP